MKMFWNKAVCIKSMVAGVLIFGFLISAMCCYAQADNIVPEVDMNQKIDISIFLEDESRFMEVELYRIGQYDGDKFTYLTQYRELVDKDYYALDTVKQKDASVKIIANYIENHKDIVPDASLCVVKGEGKTKDLPIGLYLIIQNDGNHNAELDKAVLTEAPLFDEIQNIYLYDICLYPKWERSIWFSFRPEVVYPLETVMLLTICFLLCIYSTRLIRSLGFLTIFLVSGLLGMRLGMEITKEFIWLMFFYVGFAFLGIGLAWMIFAIAGGALKKSDKFGIVKRNMYRIVPVFSGLFGGYILYRFVSKAWWCFVLIPSVTVCIGEVVQYIRKDKETVFYTYEDLLKLQKGEMKAEQ